MIEPVRPSPIPVGPPIDLFPEGVSLRLVNAFDAPRRAPLRSEGIHHLEVDLRDWSARLVSELAFELQRRRVRVAVPSESLEGTTSVTATVPREQRPGTTGARTLRIAVVEVRAPSAEEHVALLCAEVESADGLFLATYATSPAAKTFKEAFDEIKRAILGDPGFLATILESTIGT